MSTNIKLHYPEPEDYLQLQNVGILRILIKRISMATVGKEYTKTIDIIKRYIDYRYLHTDGSTFRCIKPSLEDCRSARDLWIKECYLLGDRLIVFDNKSLERFLVFNPNLKGCVVLVGIKATSIRIVGRRYFFQMFSLAGAGRQPELLGEEGAYVLMLKAYHYHFRNKKNNNQIQSNYE